MNKSEIARALSLPGKQRPELRATLREMEEAGTLIYGKKGRYFPPMEDKPLAGQNDPRPRDRRAARRSSNTFVGPVRINPNGHGWFYPDPSAEENRDQNVDLSTAPRFYVSSKALSVALDGDVVRAKLVRGDRGGRTNRDGDDRRARVLDIVERRSGKVTGLLRIGNRGASLEAQDERVPDGIRVDDFAGAKNGQVVVVQINQWEDPRDRPSGKVVEVLGFPGDKGVDIQQIIHQHGVAQAFPKAVLSEARKIKEKVPQAEIDRREDWRDRDIITIDPATAKDYDDAVYVERSGKGWQLAVHIADVSHYVKPGSELDREARERGNSTYLVDRVIPMLPEELSNGVCSLKPGVDRLTKCAVLNFSEDGTPGKVRFCDAIIKTPRKFTYGEAQDILKGRASGGKLGEQVHRCWELADVLRRRRYQKGALDLEMKEVRLILDEDNHPTGYDCEPYNESHQLIEEFMLAANEAVARKIKNARRPGIYRVHGDPDADRLNEYAEMARTYGYQPGDLTNRAHIQDLLDAAKGSPEEHAIKVGLLKSLKRACYMASPEGHYGLAKSDYCHFTSPIRRYADLIIHRSLQPLLDNPPKKTDRTPSKEECAEIAQHISDTERTSASAESESRRMKMMEYLESLLTVKEPPLFDAIVTEVRSLGLFIECTDIMEKGLVRREGMPEGHWTFDNALEAYLSNTGKRLAMGQRLKLQVSEVDHVAQRVNFKIAALIGSPPKAPKRQPPRDFKTRTGKGRTKTGTRGQNSPDRGKSRSQPRPRRKSR